MRKVDSYKDNTIAAAALMFGKCTPRLQARIENGSDVDHTKSDAILMKLAIKKHATSSKQGQHPLTQMVEALRTLVNVKQADELKKVADKLGL